MKSCILMGSPRKEGNTAQLTVPFQEELERQGVNCSKIWLYDKEIQPCRGCRGCQQDWRHPACIQMDDMESLSQEILDCDLLVLATPVYSWYCTPPVKALLDRLVYSMNKYYGETKGPSLWEGKKVALVTTCGYRPEQGADLWEEGIRRYCKHSRLSYLGMLAERHLGYHTVFMDEEKEWRAKAFAQKLWKEIQ